MKMAIAIAVSTALHLLEKRSTSPSVYNGNGRVTKHDKALAFLKRELDGKVRKSKPLRERAMKKGIHYQTLRTAANELGVKMSAHGKHEHRYTTWTI